MAHILIAEPAPTATASLDRELTTVGERIHRRRLELGLSQRALACEGVSYAYVSRIEAGTRQPSVTALRKLARKLDVSAHWLESGKDDPALELARVVLEHRGELLPDHALALARTVLGDTAPSV